MAATFRAGGLASGIDSNAIIDQLVALRKKPIEKLETLKRTVDIKVSVLGSLRSKLQAFDSAIKALAADGARGVRVAREPASVKATPSPSSSVGSYSLEVSELAQAAKSRSGAFASGAVATGGELHIDADGIGYNVTVADGATLSEVAKAIEDSGAPVTASVLFDGASSHLVLTRTTTGHVIGDLPSSALAITETSTGVLGQPLGFTVAAAAKNAQFSIDGLPFERRSNEVSDALPGTTLSLAAKTASAETLVLSNDSAKTKENLQKVLDAYNAIISMVQAELNVKAETDRSQTLGGEPAVRAIQTRLQGLITQEIGTGTVRTLADLGVRSARDGTLSIEDAAFQRAVQADPSALDKLLDGGLASAADAVVDVFVDSTEGSLTLRSKALADQKRRAEDQVAVLEARAEAYRDMLIAQYAAMEKVVSSLKAIGNFLSSQSSSKKSGDQ